MAPNLHTLASVSFRTLLISLAQLNSFQLLYKSRPASRQKDTKASITLLLMTSYEINPRLCTCMARQTAQKYFWESSRYLFGVWDTLFSLIYFQYRACDTSLEIELLKIHVCEKKMRVWSWMIAGYFFQAIPGNDQMPLLPIRKLPEASSIGQVSWCRGWCFMALGGIWKAFQVAFWSSQILGEKFDI